MADIALKDSLIDEYLKYKFQDGYNQTTIRKLLKYIQPFAIREDNECLQDPSMMSQLENDPLIEIVDNCSDVDLVQNTVLKLMLSDSMSATSYISLNLNSNLEKLQQKYAATYSTPMGKQRAQQHIKALLSDANYVIITDGYIATSRQWNDNKSLIADIVPNSNIDLTIIGADKGSEIYVLNQPKKDELKVLLPNLREVKATQLSQNSHDRYIETDKLKILISSGLEHLSSSSTKDFTYIVDIK